MANASSLLNDMTALSKGKFKSYITVNDIKKEVYYLYTFEEDIEFENQLGGYGDNVADQIIDSFSQRVLDQLYDATTEERDSHFERMNRLRDQLKSINIQADKDSLLAAWNNMDNSLEEGFRRDHERNNESLGLKVEERRRVNRLKKMEALRIVHEEEEAKLMLDQLNKEYSRKGEINRDQICKIIRLL